MGIFSLLLNIYLQSLHVSSNCQCSQPPLSFAFCTSELSLLVVSQEMNPFCLYVYYMHYNILLYVWTILCLYIYHIYGFTLLLLLHTGNIFLRISHIARKTLPGRCQVLLSFFFLFSFLLLSNLWRHMTLQTLGTLCLVFRLIRVVF